MPKAWCAFGYGVVDVLPTVPRLRVNSFECGCILRRISIGWEDRCSAEELIDPINPDLVTRIDFPFREVILAAKNLRFEIPDHSVASGNSGGRRCSSSEKPFH